MTDDDLRQSTALQVALDIKTDIEEYVKSRDYTALVNALKDQFLAQRHISASKTEQSRQLAAEVLPLSSILEGTESHRNVIPETSIRRTFSISSSCGSETEK